MGANNYRNGFRWGERVISKEYREEGEKAFYRCDKAAKTCRRYASDKQLTKTKSGKLLTDELRSFYRGIADGLQNGYGKL